MSQRCKRHPRPRASEPTPALRCRAVTGLRILLLSAIVTGSCLGPADNATATPAVSLQLSASQRGWIAATVTGPPNADVQIAETGAMTTTRLRTDQDGRAAETHAATWRCDRRRRTFTATAAGLPPVTASVRTGSCAGRLVLSFGSSRFQAGRPVEVRLVDRWKAGGVSAEVCARSPSGSRTCREVNIAERSSTATWRFRPSRPGRWRFSAAAAGTAAVRTTATVRRRSGRLRLLATGDSMIQILDAFLKQRLTSKTVSVRTESHVSTGITKPSLLNWPARARAQARSIKPDVTIMFLGANDGFGIGQTPCCGDKWVDGYARRARGMMRSYQRKGSGTVYWMLLPVPKRREFQRVFRGVNAALRRAAKDSSGGVRLVDLPKVFTPGGRFRSRMRWQGKMTTVRQSDGVHLSTAGASIAATVIIRQLRKDGEL